MSTQYYNGFEFATQEEAQWAVFFDELNIAWCYLHKGNEKLWMPQFYLPCIQTPWTDLDGIGAPGCFVAVLPTFTKRDIDQAMCFSRIMKLDPARRALLCVGDLTDLARGMKADEAILDCQETLGLRYSMTFLTNNPRKAAFFYEDNTGRILIDSLAHRNYDRVNTALEVAAEFFD